MPVIACHGQDSLELGVGNMEIEIINNSGGLR